MRGLERGDVTERRANATTYALSVLANVVAGSDVEQRLRALEEKRKP